MLRGIIFFLITTVLFMSTAVVSAASIEGIELPDVVQTVNGVDLKRNGHGVRSISFFGMKIKVYVAGFYSKSPLLSEKDIMECCHRSTTGGEDCPMQFDFIFLRSVGKGQVISAWSQQLEHSVSYEYDGYEKDRDIFIEMFSSHIAYSGTQTVQIIGDETVIIDQGVRKGIIRGRDFQRAFLSMWFGERAVGEDLKSGFLSGAVHLKEAADDS
jgi:hypothetical protein